MLAALVAVMTFPDLFRGRDVLFFVDNVSTLSACVHGYSARPELGALSQRERHPPYVRELGHLLPTRTGQGKPRRHP